MLGLSEIDSLSKYGNGEENFTFSSENPILENVAVHSNTDFLQLTSIGNFQIFFPYHQKFQKCDLLLIKSFSSCKRLKTSLFKVTQHFSFLSLDFLNQSQPIDIKQFASGYVEVVGEVSLGQEEVQETGIKKESLPLPGCVLGILRMIFKLFVLIRFSTSLDEE